ncbi:MAG: divalent-cation tolerance protein CutA [Alphaproteobacteria bacterium]|nr:divalent-cation tolerance protein CutA [Alphaproteobacteria bacterium]
MPNFISVHITTATRPEAEKIARTLVEEKLAACANIVPGIRSIYRWEGKVEEGDEILLIVKTRADLFEPLRKLVKALHSYQCPCIVALPVTVGHQPYLDWMAQETQS